jgi:sec-independent protein translocase protein TatA
MGAMSPFHWIIVLLVIVLLFGSKKIPELAKGLGQGLKEFKKATKDADKETDVASATTEKPEKKDAAEK